MPTNFTNQEVVISELIFLLVGLSLYGTVCQILSVLLELLILISYECVMTYKLVYYRAPVSAADVALLSCMYVLLCEYIWLLCK